MNGVPDEHKSAALIQYLREQNEMLRDELSTMTALLRAYGWLKDESLQMFLHRRAKQELHRRALCEAIGVIAGEPISLNAAVNVARVALQDCGYMDEKPHPFNAFYMPNNDLSRGEPAAGET